jgi:hypothetical protein
MRAPNFKKMSTEELGKWIADNDKKAVSAFELDKIEHKKKGCTHYITWVHHRNGDDVSKYAWLNFDPEAKNLPKEGKTFMTKVKRQSLGMYRVTKL